MTTPDPDVQPRFSPGGVPMCSTDDCPSFDGKRCRALGHRPDAICEPAVIAIATERRRSDKAVVHALSSLGDIASAIRRRGADRDRGVAQLVLESIETEIRNINAILGGS